MRSPQPAAVASVRRRRTARSLPGRTRKHREPTRARTPGISCRSAHLGHHAPWGAGDPGTTPLRYRRSNDPPSGLQQVDPHQEADRAAAWTDQAGSPHAPDRSPVPIPAGRGVAAACGGHNRSARRTCSARRRPWHEGGGAGRTAETGRLGLSTVTRELRLIRRTGPTNGAGEEALRPTRRSRAWMGGRFRSLFPGGVSDSRALLLDISGESLFRPGKAVDQARFKVPYPKPWGDGGGTTSGGGTLSPGGERGCLRPGALRAHPGAGPRCGGGFGGGHGAPQLRGCRQLRRGVPA